MNIPKMILSAWKLSVKHGEIETIHKNTGVSRNTISNALKNGNCEESTFIALKKYFADKKEAENKLVKETLS